MLVWYYLMDSELHNLKRECKLEENFEEYVSSLNELLANEKEKQEKNSPVFRYIQDSLQKHFKQWCSDLLFLCLFSGHRTTAQVAKIILVRREITNDDNDEYNDEHQKRKISIRAFNPWLIGKCDLTDIMNTRSMRLSSRIPKQLHSLQMDVTFGTIVQLQS